MKIFKLKFDTLFFSLVLFVAAINLPLFLNIVIPVHDTIYFFHDFYFFYNELYSQGELAHWVPFGYYGLQSDYFLIALSPAYYLTGLFGYIFGITNAFALFKAGVFLEQVVFLFGVYRLAGITFKRKATVAFVCLASVGGTVLLSQILFNFRTYYLLPLTIYLIVRFFSTYKPQYVLGAMLAGVVSILGGAPYIAAIFLLQMAVIVPVFFVGNLRTIQSAKMPVGRDILISLLIIVLIVSFAVSYHYFVMHMLDETRIMPAERDPLTGATDLKTFLTYGQEIGWTKFSDLFSPYGRLKGNGSVHIVYFYDSSLYFGVIPLFFSLYGLFFARKLREPLYLSVLILAVVLALLSVGEGTPVAAWLYKRFPMMKYYRHIGYVTACFKFLIPLLAGFGFEHFISRIESAGGKKGNLWDYLIAVIFLSSGISIAHSLESVVPADAFVKTSAVYMAFVLSAIGLMLWLRGKLNPRVRTVALVLVFYVIEIISYQALVDEKFAQLEKKTEPLNKAIFHVERYQFQPERMNSMPHQRAQSAFPLRFGSALYALGYNFMQWDPCIPEARADLLNKNVYSLITLWGFPLPINPNLTLPFIGCNSPKLRLLSDVTLAESPQEAADILKSEPPTTDIVVLNDAPEEVLREWKDKPHPLRAAGKIAVTDFRANGLDLDVEVSEGPLWLYYAAASPRRLPRPI
jgi:hypothetical protein